MSKKKHDDHEEHVNHEAWVIPYADLMTLLMAMFIVLWALGNTDAGKIQQVQAGFADALNIGPAGGAIGVESTEAAAPVSKEDVAELQGKVGEATAIQRQADLREAKIRSERADLEETRKEIQHQLELKGLTDQVQTRLTPEGLLVVATEGLLFGSGSATLDDGGSRAIDLIAEPMLSLTQPIRIEGHTDSVPVATAQFPSNWELSSARASTVLRHLIGTFSFPPGRLSSAGYADTHPAGDNATAEGRAANRRVEILVVAQESIEPLQPGSNGEPGRSGVTGVPAPIGEEGPLGAPLEIEPALPKPDTASDLPAPTAARAEAAAPDAHH
jgi:chemotaxis protein MotB